MRGTTVIAALAVVLLVSAGHARAQPGRTAPQPPPGRTAPPPPPGYVQLTAEEQRVLAMGEYTDGEIVGGGLVGTLFGLGIGHMIQGRWLDRGWIYTTGEVASMGLVVYGLNECIVDYTLEDEADDNGDCIVAMSVGALFFSAFRIAEIVDVWKAPLDHNRRVRAARARTQPPTWRVYAAPARGGGATGGVAFRF